MVLLKSRARISDRPQRLTPQILLAADIVDDSIGDGIVKQPVDREIPTPGIFLSRGELHLRRPSSVQVFAIRAKRRHLNHALARAHKDHAKRLPDRLRASKEAPHFCRHCIRCHVVILRLQPSSASRTQPPAKYAT